MPRVNLPPGCAGLTSADGTRYKAKAGTSVSLSDEHFARLRNSQHAAIGMISVDGAVSVGTRKGRWCAPCHFLGQAWSITCPKCGGFTEEA